MSWKSLLLGSATLALMLEPMACGLSTSGIEPENGEGGAGGASSSTAQSGSSGSGTSSSSGSPKEDCFNSKDDDSNQQTDCQDPACSGVTQCADVPVGWTVIRATLVGDASLPPGVCADGTTPRTAYFTQPGGPATCSPCQCNLSPASKCAAPQISCYYSNDTCGGGNGTVQQPIVNGCLPLPGVPAGSNNSGSCNITKPASLLGGGCAQSGGTPTKGPMWGGAVFVCDAPSSPAGCMNGQQCVPAGASPEGPICIKKDGNDMCPAGWTTMTSAFASGQDNRGCGACQCSAGCAGGGYVVHDDNSCLSAGIPVAPNGCTTAQGLFDSNAASILVTVATAVAAGCNGGQPMGQVDPAGPVQICCK